MEKQESGSRKQEAGTETTKLTTKLATKFGEAGVREQEADDKARDKAWRSRSQGAGSRRQSVNDYGDDHGLRGDPSNRPP